MKISWFRFSENWLRSYLFTTADLTAVEAIAFYESQAQLSWNKNYRATFIRNSSPGFRGQCVSLYFRWHNEYTRFLIQFTHTHIYTHMRKSAWKECLLFITEALTLLVILSGAICRQAIKVFPVLKQNFGSHKYKDEREAENSCSMVVSFPSMGNRKGPPRVLCIRSRDYLEKYWISSKTESERFFLSRK